MKKERPEPRLLVRIANESSESRLPRKLLLELLDFAYSKRRKKSAAIDILVLDDAGIAKLNRRHLGRDHSTDVLAFDDGEEDPDGRIRLGDVAISAETARREAGAHGVGFTRELAFYAVHGLFHLLGMDDGSPADREAMQAAQADAMREYGLAVGDRLVDAADKDN